MDFHIKLVFVSGKPFQPSLIFEGQAWSLPRVEHLKHEISLERITKDKHSSLLRKSVITTVKSFIVQAPDQFGLYLRERSDPTQVELLFLPPLYWSALPRNMNLLKLIIDKHGDLFCPTISDEERNCYRIDRRVKMLGKMTFQLVWSKLP